MITAALSVFLAAVESFAFVPEFINYFAPNFPLLVCFYWATNTNINVSLWVPFGIGFLLDTLLGYPFGSNSLILCLVTYIGMRIPKRENKPILQFQLVGLGIVIIFAELLRHLSVVFIEDATFPSPMIRVYGIVGTFIAWVIVAFILDRWLVSVEAEVTF